MSVPVGLARCACPVCGAELAVDTARLRHYLLSSATAEGALPVVPLGDPSAPPILQAQQVRQEHPNFGIRAGLLWTDPDNRTNCMGQVQTNHPNQLIPEQADLDNPGSTIERGEVHDVSGIFTKRTSMHSVGPGIVSPERRHEEPQNHDRHQGQVQSSTTRINCGTGQSAAPQTVNIEKRQLLTPDQTIQQAQKQPSCRAICTEKAHAEDADGVIHVQEKQQQCVSQVNHTEELCTQAADEIITRDSNGTRVGYTACSDAAFAERRKVHEANDPIKQVQTQQSDSAVHMEPENQVIHVEKEQSKSFSCRTPKQKKKGLTAASNPGLQLRRSKRLVKDSPASIDQEPVQNEFLESQEGTSISHIPATVRVSEPTENDSDSQHAGSPEQSEPTESDPDWQHAGSPEQSLSDSPDINRIINNLKPSPSPPCEMHEPSSNKLDSPHLTTPTSNSDLNLSDPEQFARNYIPSEVRKALPELRSNSLFEHTMSQANYGEGSLHDLTDSEGDDPCSPTLQNVAGTKRNHRRLRCGLKLSLEVWTLPKGVRIPVSLNTSGEPVGKAAGTLSNFLCAIARDGVLAPLTYHDWRRVPEKNKNIIWHIVKLKFDIAPVGELWIMKSLGKRWRSWKSFLKLQHYDTHETEEERLADRNPRVLKEQWQFLVAYWSTEKAKAASARSKACQSNVVAHHTAGTKSFARIIEEEVIQSCFCCFRDR
uniref:FORGETTER1 second zinc ribbon domain-containing protein n=1 Tax=Aegilops tauschii subsp. strangulata TaxID=200361 RepID=A0A453CS37_AEGTS